MFTQQCDAQFKAFRLRHIAYILALPQECGTQNIALSSPFTIPTVIMITRFSVSSNASTIGTPLWAGFAGPSDPFTYNADSSLHFHAVFFESILHLPTPLPWY